MPVAGAPVLYTGGLVLRRPHVRRSNGKLLVVLGFSFGFSQYSSLPASSSSSPLDLLSLLVAAHIKEQ